MRTKSQINVRHCLLGTWKTALAIYAIAFALLVGLKAQAQVPEPAEIETKKTPATPAGRTSLSQQQREARLAHARELLGSSYRRSVVRHGQEIKKINGFVYRFVRDSLPAKHRKKHQEVAQTIIDESLKHGFDPVLLLAVIQRESSFNPDAKGGLDEIGLMQLRPGTAKWIAEMEGIKFNGEKSLKDPISNIKIGSAYLAYLRGRFDSHARLYLAAYNMGQTKVRSKVKGDAWPREYPIAVMQNYVDFYAQLKARDEKLVRAETRATTRLTASSDSNSEITNTP